MTQQRDPAQKAIRWNRIAAMSAGIVTCVSIAVFFWPRPPKVTIPPRVVEPPPPFAPSPAFETENDLAVLRVVLESSCQVDRPAILSSQPGETLGSRSNKPANLPVGLGCAGIRIVDSQEIEILFNKAYRGKGEHQGGWGNFYDTYPDATGLLSLSLPSYPSPTSAVVNFSRACGYLCGTGWEFSLVKINGKWVIREKSLSWIS